MTPETYLGVHLLFVVPLILVLGILTYARSAATWGKVPFFGLFVVLVLAFLYTTPWDNLLIDQGVWWYGSGATRAHVWAAPIGEYLFFVLQPILAALWLYNLDIPTEGSLRIPGRTRLAGLVAGLAVGACGAGLLLADPSRLYLGAILVWAGPILAIQWAFGWPHLVRARRTVALGIGVPTVYLWFVDWYAITNGLWTISTTYTVGIAAFGLPIEEMLFFLITNVFIVQGLVLYLWLVEQWPTVAPDVRAAVPPAVVGLFPAGKRRAVADGDPDERGEESDRTVT
ncbi:lycopene cyclase domain-containing protein [Natronomonas sp. F2-12]|jgi:lycopene cyclase domain-containing protein|uniref:Lycopene cyclase domain-containing protein n=1 Tax=Natronomonas aquatica TaxID=2841590 RepID=A0A9R1CS18_9EURY|nr:lycopene cyclase domain-containing protein [Natronomonas aquatica]MCQ4334144.1 lycopene cyclase domain-containing protein [Natronomonas aquatica]